MPNAQVRILEPGEPSQWDEKLLAEGGFVALDAWPAFLRGAYGLRSYRLAALEGADTAGLLVLTHVRHPVFGNYLTTAPFASYGGFAFRTGGSRDALLGAAQELGASLDVDHVLIRFAAGSSHPLDGWQQHPAYATYILEMQLGSEARLASFGADHRNHVRKSLRKGFVVSYGHTELLEDAYAVLARSMHELGSPYHARRYLEAMLDALGDRIEMLVLRDARGELAGAGVFIFHSGMATNLHANILRRFRPTYAGEFLYWSAIERCRELGLQALDLGRSLVGSGNEIFKLKWKPRREILAYWYHLRKGDRLPELNQVNPRFRLAIWTWKKLPFFATRLLGPSLIRGLA